MAFPTTYLPSIKKKLLCIIDQIEQHDYDFNATPTNGIKPWLKELSHLAAAGTDLQVEACLRSIAFHAAMIATPVNNTDEELGTAPTEPPIASTHKALDWVQQIEAIVGNIATKIGATPGVGANDKPDRPWRKREEGRPRRRSSANRIAGRNDAFSILPLIPSPERAAWPRKTRPAIQTDFRVSIKKPS